MKRISIVYSALFSVSVLAAMSGCTSSTAPTAITLRAPGVGSTFVYNVLDDTTHRTESVVVSDFRQSYAGHSNVLLAGWLGNWSYPGDGDLTLQMDQDSINSRDWLTFPLASHATKILALRDDTLHCNWLGDETRTLAGKTFNTSKFSMSSQDSTGHKYEMLLWLDRSTGILVKSSGGPEVKNGVQETQEIEITSFNAR